MPYNSEGPTVRLRRLGMELRALREAAGLNSQQAAKELGCSQSKISRVENRQVSRQASGMSATCLTSTGSLMSSSASAAQPGPGIAAAWLVGRVWPLAAVRVRHLRRHGGRSRVGPGISGPARARAAADRGLRQGRAARAEA